MVLPVFAEAIGFAAFSTVAMAVGAIEAFQKRGVDGMADGRERQRGLQLLLATKLQAGFDLDHPSFAARFVYGGIEQIRWPNRSRGARSSRLARADHLFLDPIRREDLRPIGSVFITGQQAHHPSSRPTLGRLYQRAHLSFCQALLPTPDDAGDQRPHDPSFLLDVD